MQAGVKFPPVTVFYDGSDYWLADGFHRRNAAFSAELAQMECDVRQGTREDPSVPIWLRHFSYP